MIAARVRYRYPPDLTGLIDRELVEAGRRDRVHLILDHWYHLRGTMPAVDIPPETIQPWDREPQTIYLLPHWDEYIKALQHVTGLPRRPYVPYYSKGKMLAFIFAEHRALTRSGAL